MDFSVQSLALATALALVPAAPAAAFNFSLAQTYPIDGVADSVAVGDIDGDGLDDILVMTDPGVSMPIRGELLVYRQLASGGVALPVSIEIVQGVGGDTSIVVLDLDADGSVEVAVGHGSGVTVVDWQGGLVVQQAHLAAGGATEIAGYDINRDSHTDIVGLRSGSSAHLFVADGSGGLAPAVPIAVRSYGTGRLAVADMNRDQIPDLLVMEGTTSTARNLSVYPHDGSAGLLPKVSYDVGFLELTNSIAAGDLDGDGLSDVVLGQSSGNLWHFRQHPSGGVFPPVSVATEQEPAFPLIADLNGDGNNDVLTLHRYSAQIGYMLGTSTGDFSQTLQSAPLLANNRGQQAARGELNGDDCGDLAIIDPWFGMSVMHGQSCHVPLEADLATALRISSNRLLVGASHLSGDQVNDAVVHLTVAVTRGVWVHAPPVCSGGTSNGRDYQFECALGAMRAGESSELSFNLHGLTRTYLRATSRVSSELPDPNEANNEAQLAIRG